MGKEIVNISSLFFKAIYQLAGLQYDTITFNQYSLEARAIINQFVYDPLTKEQKQQIDRRSKTHRMMIPPALDSMIDLPFVSDQVNLILSQIEQGKSYDELNEIYRTGDSVSIEEFDAILFKAIKNGR